MRKDEEKTGGNTQKNLFYNYLDTEEQTTIFFLHGHFLFACCRREGLGQAEKLVYVPKLCVTPVPLEPCS